MAAGDAHPHYFDFVGFARAVRLARGKQGYRDVERTHGLNITHLTRAERGFDIGTEAIQGLCAWMQTDPSTFLRDGHEANWRMLPEHERREWLTYSQKYIDMAVDEDRHVALALGITYPIYRNGGVVVGGRADTWLVYGIRPNGTRAQLVSTTQPHIDAAIQIVNEPRHMEKMRTWRISSYPKSVPVSRKD